MSYVRWAYQPATYKIRYVGCHIWGYRVEWCTNGNKYQRVGYALSARRAMDKGERRCQRINDPVKKWRNP